VHTRYQVSKLPKCISDDDTSGGGSSDDKSGCDDDDNDDGGGDDGGGGGGSAESSSEGSSSSEEVLSAVCSEWVWGEGPRAMDAAATKAVLGMGLPQAHLEHALVVRGGEGSPALGVMK